MIEVVIELAIDHWIGELGRVGPPPPFSTIQGSDIDPNPRNCGNENCTLVDFQNNARFTRKRTKKEHFDGILGFYKKVVKYADCFVRPIF